MVQIALRIPSKLKAELQLLADKHFEGDLSQQVRKLLREALDREKTKR
jgi:hypothetical protein